MANFGHGPVSIVGQAVDHHSHAGMRVAFVANFLVVDALEFAGGFLDGALDGVLGHIGRIGLIDGEAQTRICIRVTTPFPGSHTQLTVDAREDFSTFGVNRFLAMLDVGPFTVSGHTIFPCLILTEP